MASPREYPFAPIPLPYTHAADVRASSDPWARLPLLRPGHPQTGSELWAMASCVVAVALSSDRLPLPCSHVRFHHRGPRGRSPVGADFNGILASCRALMAIPSRLGRLHIAGAVDRPWSSFLRKGSDLLNRHDKTRQCFQRINASSRGTQASGWYGTMRGVNSSAGRSVGQSAR